MQKSLATQPRKSNPVLEADFQSPVITDEVWQNVLKAKMEKKPPPAAGYAQCFAGVCQARSAYFIGQLGQSLDGLIATDTGDSYYINAQEGLAHLHRLRALVDAVVIGVGTAIKDNPQLTVRHVQGNSPARIIVDPSGRLPLRSTCLQDDGCRKIVLTSEGLVPQYPDFVEHRILPLNDKGRICCAAIKASLQDFQTVLIEGGAWTLSNFYQTGLLNQLHLIIAPLIIGSGKKGIALPPTDSLSRARRPQTNWYSLGTDLLADLHLNS